MKKKENYMFKNYTILKKYFKTQKIALVVLLILVAGNIIFQLFMPNLLSVFMDKLLLNPDKRELLKIVTEYVILTVANILISILITYFSQRIGCNASNRLREDLVRDCLNFDMKFHNKKTSGEIIEVIDTDVNNLSNFLSYMGVSMLCNILLFIGVIISYFFKNILMGAIQLTYAVIALVLINKFKNRSVEYRKRTRDYQSNLVSCFGETLEFTEDIAGNGAKGFIYDKIESIFARWLPDSVKSSKAGWGMFIVILLLQAVGYFNCFVVGTILWAKGIISVGTIYLFYSYTKYILNPINELQGQMQDLQNVNASLMRLEKLITNNVNKEQQYRNEEDYIIEENSDLVIQNVSFGYDRNQKIIKNINCVIKANSTVAIVGKTGCGKSTLVSLIMRIYDVDKGKILIGNRNINEISIKSLRKQVIYITQGLQVLNETLRNNIKLYDESITDADILDGIKKLGIESIYEKFKDGLDTYVSTSNIGVSSGELQVILLLRAFVRKPKIVILDEVTSKLDSGTEKIVLEAIKKLLDRKIGIIIAHKVQAINFAENILSMEDGKFVDKSVNDLLSIGE